MKITEENFIAQLKERNEEALEYVIDNYAWILKTVIKRHLYRLPHLYEECMNDCLWAIWNHIDCFDPERNDFKNWIGGIARYKSIDYVRKYLRDLENKDVEKMVIPVEDESLKDVLTQEFTQEVEQLINSLPETTRDIFRQLFFEEKDIDELALSTGLSKPVLYNRISRGKRKLRELMGGY